MTYSQNLPIKRKCYSLEVYYHNAFLFAEKQKIGLIEVDPSQEFAPIKAVQGALSMSEARKALRDAHKRWMVEAGVKL